MPAAEINAYLTHHVPLVRAMNVRVSSFDARGVTLSAPLAPNVNDKGTAFGGALASILSLSGWALCYLLLEERSVEADLVIAESAIQYHKPVHERITAICPMPEVAAVEGFFNSLRDRGKASWVLNAEVKTGGETNVTFRGRYAAIRPGNILP
jgi:thioesterase domain-containing protein